MRGDIYKHKGENENAFRDYLMAYELTTNENKRRTLQNKLDEVEELCIPPFEEEEKIYVQSFWEQPYQKRKLIVPVDNKVHIPLQRTLSVLDIGNLPKGIYFHPGGIPVTNRLYICHPHSTHIYIPFENYELEFVDEKLKEFSHLMQCLGATEVTIESINGKSRSDYSKKSQSGSDSFDIQGKAKALLGGGSVGGQEKTNYNRENENSMDESITQFFTQSQKFTPTKFPYIPKEGLVWYPYERDWQGWVKQRMQGSLLEHHVKIGTQKSRMVEQSELSQIEEELNVAVKASIKLFSASVNVNTSNAITTKNEIKLGLKEDVELSIYVRFAPMDALRNANDGNAIELEVFSSSSYSEEELEYLEELKSCLSEGNEISPKERRLLVKLSDTLGISEERAIEIENSLVIPSFTENEKEYMEEFKACFEEGNEISEKERRLLNKVRIGLDISEERAYEIETFITNN